MIKIWNDKMSSQANVARVGVDFRLRALLLILALLAALLVAPGCSKSGGGASGVAANPNELPEVAKVRQAFESAAPALKFPVDDALRIVNSGAYADAVPAIKRLAANTALTPAQKQSLNDLADKLQTAGPPAAKP